MKLKGRACDFCGRKIEEKCLFLGSRFVYDLKIKTASGERLDVCHECAGILKEYCKRNRKKRGNE